MHYYEEALTIQVQNMRHGMLFLLMIRKWHAIVAKIIWEEMQNIPILRNLR
jgi:hypothetical protein